MDEQYIIDSLEATDTTGELTHITDVEIGMLLGEMD
jgi:hypothetical protein